MIKRKGLTLLITITVTYLPLGFLLGWFIYVILSTLSQRGEWDAQVHTAGKGPRQDLILG